LLHAVKFDLKPEKADLKEAQECVTITVE